MLIAGCGKKISEESGGLFETLSTEEVSGVQGAEASKEAMGREAMEGSKPAGTKEETPDKEEPEETASRIQEIPPETEKTLMAKLEKTAEPVKTTEPDKPAEPPQAPASAPEPVREPEQTPTPAHTHTYVQETTAATCTAAAVITAKCSSCGEVSGTRTEGSALGHDWEKVVHSAPTCSMKGYGYSRCKRCGQQQDYENIACLPHDYEVTVVLEGDCQNPRVTEKVCRVCNIPEPREYDWNAHKDDHDWVTETGEVYDKEQHAWVEMSRTICAVCNKGKSD